MATRLLFLKTAIQPESRETRSVPLPDVEILDSQREPTRRGR